MEVKLKYIIFCIIFEISCARIHKLNVKDDGRKYFAVSTFGFYKGGFMDVKLNNFRATPFNENDMFGFSLDRTLTDAMNDSHQDICLLQQVETASNEVSCSESNEAIYFILDFKEKSLRISWSHSNHQSASGIHSIQIYGNAGEIPLVLFKRGYSGPDLKHQHWRKRSASEAEGNASIKRSTSCDRLERSLPMTVAEYPGGIKYFNASFVIYVPSESDGLYSLYFYNCPNYKEGNFVALDFSMEIEETNKGNFLSAGEMSLPVLYVIMSLLFFISGCFWVFILRKSKHSVHKIHYHMAVLIYLKSLSLMFHGVNFYFIQTRGEQVAAWTILYFIAHLLKGVVFSITIVLLGSGWTFIKHTLSKKDKMILMIVIPLQVLASVADIILEDSEGAVEHRTWCDVFIVADLISCGAILFPVIWSIRHLREASATYGKAGISLLKLFRHFLIMIVCYIYLTRIIVYLLKITVSFQYEWVEEMVREMATCVLYVLIGFKFQPVSTNRYFQRSTDDDKEEVVVACYYYITPDMKDGPEGEEVNYAERQK